MLEPFYATLGNFDELDKLNKIMTENKIPFDQKIIEHVFRYLDSVKAKLDYTSFKSVMKNVVFTVTGGRKKGLFGLTHVAYDERVLSLFDRITSYLMQKGYISSVDNSIMDSCQLIKNALSSHEVNLENHELARKLSVAILRLSDYPLSEFSKV
ncbi:unnamed protein product [Ambrosiozyma monospora]|uniref:Unnamed protein product n=1 Tax=Ambrosiozyma monospora TaxID=43982 RepID=A0ACB5U177_AMBMO|nr:unnamed protein product [Ambrosiozyma monospora]